MVVEEAALMSTLTTRIHPGNATVHIALVMKKRALSGQAAAPTCFGENQSGADHDLEISFGIHGMA
jgi:hypothetical protein